MHNRKWNLDFDGKSEAFFLVLINTAQFFPLKAAHCVAVRINRTDLFSVHVESAILYPSNPNVVFAETIYHHQGYNASNQYINDIALIKLKEPLRIKLFDWKVKLAMRGAYYKTRTPAVLAGKIVEMNF